MRRPTRTAGQHGQAANPTGGREDAPPAADRRSIPAISGIRCQPESAERPRAVWKYSGMNTTGKQREANWPR